MSGPALFFELVSGTLSFMGYFFPATLVVAGLWVWGLWATFRDSAEPPANLAAWCVLPAGLTFAVLLVGTAFPHSAESSAVPTYVIGALVFGHLPLAGYLAWRSGNRWPVVVASSAVWGWVSVCAAFVAVMAVTGDWL